jgi:hypothetical protein
MDVGFLFLIYAVLPNLISMVNLIPAGGTNLEETPHPHHHKVFPASRAGILDTRFRLFLYRPDRLAERHIKIRQPRT